MTGNRETFTKLMDQGHSSVWEGNWPQAAQYYRQALDEEPENTNALSSLGLALTELQEYGEAIKVYMRVLRLRPDDPATLEKVGQVYERQNKPEQAVTSYSRAAEIMAKARNPIRELEIWKRVTEIQSNHLEAHSKLALIYEQMGKKSEAAQEYVSLASIFQKRGEPEDVIIMMDKANVLSPDNPLVLSAKRCLTKNRPISDALDSFFESVSRTRTEPVHDLSAEKSDQDVDPVSDARQKSVRLLADMLFAEAEAAFDTGQQERNPLRNMAGIQVAGQVKQKDIAQIQRHLGRSIEYQAQGNADKAAAELQQAVSAGLTETPPVIFNLGLLHYKTDTKKALQYLEKASSSPDFSLASYLLAGQIHEGNKDIPHAASAYMFALWQADLLTSPKENSSEIDTLYEAVLESQFRTMQQDSLQKFCESVRFYLLRPDWRTVIKNSRAQYATLDDDLVLLYQIINEGTSPHEIDHLARIRKLANTKDYFGAMNESLDALLESPISLPLHIQIADMLLKQGRIQDALTKFLLVADIFELRGETPRAIRLLYRVIKAAPMDLKIRTRLVDLLTKQKNHKGVVEQLTGLASIYYQLADLENARTSYNSALRLSQKIGLGYLQERDILLRLADIDLQRLDYPKAIQTYQELHSKAPDDIYVLRQLITIYFRSGRESQARDELDRYLVQSEKSGQRKEAIEFLSELMGEYPGSTRLRVLLAGLYMRNHQKKEAVDVLDNLADQFLTNGKNDEAAAILQKIISLKPDNVTEYTEALAILQKGS